MREGFQFTDLHANKFYERRIPVQDANVFGVLATDHPLCPSALIFFISSTIF